MKIGSCPVLALNYPACGCEDGECEAFDEFGMACDNCDHAGHRDAQGWTLISDGSVWCDKCVRDLTVAPDRFPDESAPGSL